MEEIKTTGSASNEPDFALLIRQSARWLFPLIVAVIRWDEFCMAHSATTINENGTVGSMLSRGV